MTKAICVKSNFIHIIVTFTSQSEQYTYIQEQQITCLCFIYFLEQKKRVGRKNTFRGDFFLQICMWGKNIFKRLVIMLPFLNMLVCFISIKCYAFFQSSSLRYTCTNFKLKHTWCFLSVFTFKYEHFSRSKIKLIESELSFPFTFGYVSLHKEIFL